MVIRFQIYDHVSKSDAVEWLTNQWGLKIDRYKRLHNVYSYEMDDRWLYMGVCIADVSMYTTLHII